jgi:hypothetical protein
MHKATGTAVKRVFLNPFNIQLIEPKNDFFDSEDKTGNKIQMYLNHISSKITEYLVNVVPYKSSNAGSI